MSAGWRDAAVNSPERDVDEFADELRRDARSARPGRHIDLAGAKRGTTPSASWARWSCGGQPCSSTPTSVVEHRRRAMYDSNERPTSPGGLRPYVPRSTTTSRAAARDPPRAPWRPRATTPAGTGYRAFLRSGAPIARPRRAAVGTDRAARQLGGAPRRSSRRRGRRVRRRIRRRAVRGGGSGGSRRARQRRPGRRRAVRGRGRCGRRSRPRSVPWLTCSAHTSCLASSLARIQAIAWRRGGPNAKWVTCSPRTHRPSPITRAAVWALRARHRPADRDARRDHSAIGQSASK
jgi:hypothetical protein